MPLWPGDLTNRAVGRSERSTDEPIRGEDRAHEVDLDDWDGEREVGVVLLVGRVTVSWLEWSPREISGAP